jgi:hypothetical protein
MDTVIANVFLIPARSVPIRTTPGRQIFVRSGYGKVTEPRDMPHVLRYVGATVQVTPSWIDWLPDWMHAAGEAQVKATLQLPEGVTIGDWPDFPLTGWPPPSTEPPAPPHGGRSARVKAPPTIGWSQPTAKEQAE